MDEALCACINRTAKIDPLYNLAQELFDIGMTEQQFMDNIKKEGDAGAVINYAAKWKVYHHLEEIWERQLIKKDDTPCPACKGKGVEPYQQFGLTKVCKQCGGVGKKLSV